MSHSMIEPEAMWQHSKLFNHTATKQVLIIGPGSNNFISLALEMPSRKEIPLYSFQLPQGQIREKGQVVGLFISFL